MISLYKSVKSSVLWGLGGASERQESYREFFLAVRASNVLRVHPLQEGVRRQVEAHLERNIIPSLAQQHYSPGPQINL